MLVDTRKIRIIQFWNSTIGTYDVDLWAEGDPLVVPGASVIRDITHDPALALRLMTEMEESGLEVNPAARRWAVARRADVLTTERENER